MMNFVIPGRYLYEVSSRPETTLIKKFWSLDKLNFCSRRTCFLFTQDLDEVRIGILKHLADFLRMLKPQRRREYLPRLSEFLKMDNDRNWRFRQELADQLGLLVPLFSPQEVKDFLAPIAIVLVRDKVSAVRQSAVAVHIQMVRTLIGSENPDLARNLLSSLVNQLANASRWVQRQTFAVFCENLFDDSSVDHEKVSNEVLSHLLDLAWDNVPNVRLSVAKAICQIKATSKYILSIFFSRFFIVTNLNGSWFI